MKAVSGDPGFFRITDDLFQLLDQDPNPVFEAREPVWITPEPAMPGVELNYRARDWAVGLVLADRLGPPAAPAEDVDDGRKVGPFIQAWHTLGSIAALGNPSTFLGVSCRGRVRYRDDRPVKYGRAESARNDRLGFQHVLMSFDPNRESPSVQIDFGDEIQGGVFEAVTYLFYALPAPVATARFRQKVLGRNPTREAVRSELARRAAMSGIPTARWTSG